MQMINAGQKDKIINERASVIDVKARGAVYSLLSRLFLKEVDKSLLNAFRTDEKLDIFGKSLEDLNSKSDEGIIDILSSEYSALFLLSGNFLSPYESVQASKEGALCGAPAVKVLQFYKSTGFNISEGCPVFPDHFGVELEFMAHLCEMEAAGSTRMPVDFRDLQAEFMRMHIGRWYKPFLEKLAKSSESPFYRELAIITMEFIGSEEEYLNGDAHLP